MKTFIEAMWEFSLSAYLIFYICWKCIKGCLLEDKIDLLYIYDYLWLWIFDQTSNAQCFSLIVIVVFREKIRSYNKAFKVQVRECFRSFWVFMWSLARSDWGCASPCHWVYSERKPICSGNTFFFGFILVLKSTVTWSRMQIQAMTLCWFWPPFSDSSVWFYVVYKLTGNSCYGSDCSYPAQSGHLVRWHRRKKSECRHLSTPIIEKTRVSNFPPNLFWLTFLRCHLNSSYPKQSLCKS